MPFFTRVQVGLAARATIGDWLATGKPPKPSQRKCNHLFDSRFFHSATPADGSDMAICLTIKHITTMSKS
jgi:hypothetical protein